ncbi:unnamed protein product [Allacma fusca]|uniref:Uncharacterized protein n=1 Tax=Allacma fusca TaxID=39272 RepID=A0A8J2KZ47_9HEXA|nr:unnamed protein product [Allacma fusca]
MKESNRNNSFTKVSSATNMASVYSYDRVSDWFDADSYKVFMRTVRSGDILEVRNNRSSHWGIAVRLKQPPSPPKGNGSPKPVPDEVMVYHLIHSSQNRGQVGQFTLEEFWQPDCKIRINNTTNGSCIFGNSPTIPKSDVLNNAFTAHLSTSMKWQTCTDFIRWSSIHHTANC